MINYDENPELNITPLVDIMLVLLAILMVAMPALIYEETITVPKGTQSKQASQNTKDLVVRIDLNRKIYINQSIFDLPSIENLKKPNFMGDLPDKLVQLNSVYRPDAKVFIKADEDLRYGDVMYVLRSLQRANYNNVALQTR